MAFPTYGDLLWTVGSLAYLGFYLLALVVAWVTSRAAGRRLPWTGIAVALVAGLVGSGAVFLLVGSVVHPAVSG